MNFPIRKTLLLLFSSILTVTLAYQVIPVYRIKLGAEDTAYVRNFFPGERDSQGNTFRWTRAESQLAFHNAGQILPTDRPITLELRMISARPAELAGPEVSVSLNGHPLGQLQVPGELSTQTFLVDPQSAGSGDWVVNLESETFTPPRDSRTLGIILRRATLYAIDNDLPVVPPLAPMLYAALLSLGFYYSLREIPPHLLRTRATLSPRLIEVGAFGVALGAIAVTGIALASVREQAVVYLPLAACIAAAGAIWALWPKLRANDRFPLRVAAGPRFARSLRLAAVLLLIVGEGSIWLIDQTALGAGLLVAAVALIWAGSRAEPFRLDARHTNPPTRGEYLALGCITLLGLALRLYNLDGVLFGLFRDETRLGLLALRVLAVPAYRPVYEGPPVSQSGMLIYLIAFAFRFLGANVVTLRLAGSLAGALTVPLLWRLARDWFGDARVALIAAFGLAVGTMHVYYSRFTLPYVESPLLSIPAYIFFTRALRGGRVRDYILAGFFFGATQYASQVSRISLILGAILLVDEVLRRRALPPNFGRGVVAAGVVGLIVLAPLLGFIIQEPDAFFARTAEVSLLSGTSTGDYPVVLLRDNILAYAGMFNIVGDSHGGHVIPTRPEFDPLLGGLFLVGIVLALSNFRIQSHRRVLFWLIAALVPGIFSIEAPAPLRVLESPAPTYILSGLGGVWLLDRALARFSASSWRTRAVPAILIALAALGALWVNAHVYFQELGTDPRLWQKNQGLSTPLGTALATWQAAGEIPQVGLLYAPEWLASQRDDRDVVSMTSGRAVRLVPFPDSGDKITPPAILARPNIAGYWKTIAARQGQTPPILLRSKEQDAEAQAQIQALAAGRHLEEVRGPNFPDSDEPAFWLYVLR